MGFFDLSIPYTDHRDKLAAKALELGLSGVAYDRTIRGVMSDRDRCSIPPLTFRHFLKHSPLLASAAEFHRDLLSVPRGSPFRQYTRLTVCVETTAQSQALNSGNPVLKTYDVVAVRPLNQAAFDLACEKLEVDIIAIDFSEKLPFRLKQHMVKAAIERKVYFEITYANLITNVQTRRQVITNAKLLVDWTRGRNLIISSAAPTANEFRGPYDVTNLMSLLGLSMERAKAAVSTNCRTLIANAVRKKLYYKEAIRIEVLPSGQDIDKNKPMSSVSLNWDPISSGEGDLPFEDLLKAFSNTSTKSSKTVKAIDFSSAIDSMPSLGFHVKDLISGTGTNVMVSQPMATSTNIIPTAKLNRQSVAADGVQEQPDRHYFPQPGQSVLCGTQVERHRLCEGPEKLDLSCDTTKTVSNVIEIENPIIKAGEEPKNPDGTDRITMEIHDMQSDKCIVGNTFNDVMEIEDPTADTGAEATNLDNIDVTTTEIHDMLSQNSMSAKTFKDATPTDPDGDGVSAEIHVVELQNCATNCELNVVPPNGNITFDTLDIGSGAACPADSEFKVPINFQDTNIPAVHNDEANSVVNADIQSDLADTNEEDKVLPSNSALRKSISEAEELKGSGDDEVIHANQVSILKSNDEMTLTDGSSVAAPEVTMEDQEHGKADGKTYPALVQSVSGKLKGKRKKPHQVTPFPLKRLLHPTPFKKARKSKRRNNMQ